MVGTETELKHIFSHVIDIIGIIEFAYRCSCYLQQVTSIILPRRNPKVASRYQSLRVASCQLGKILIVVVLVLLVLHQEGIGTCRGVAWWGQCQKSWHYGCYETSSTLKFHNELPETDGSEALWSRKEDLKRFQVVVLLARRGDHDSLVSPPLRSMRLLLVVYQPYQAGSSKKLQP